MKKIFIISGILASISIFFIILSVFVSGFDMFKLTNFNNYTRYEETFTNIVTLELGDCDIIDFKRSETNEIKIVYYTNKEAKYTISHNNSNLKVYGTIKRDNKLISNPKGVEIYLPSSNTLDVKINSNDALLNIYNIYVRNIEINNTYGVTNIDFLVCKEVEINQISGLVNIYWVDADVMDFVLNNALLNMELAYPKTKYTLDISAYSCNVSSGGDGELVIKIKSNSVVKMKFL